MKVQVREYKHIVGGELIESASGQYIETYGPSTGEVLAYLARGDERDVDRAVDAARQTFEGKAWREMAPAARGRILMRISQLIQQRLDDLAVLECRDTGKPLSQARRDVEVAARYFEFYAGAADKIQGHTIPVSSGVLAYTVREPWGVSAQIIPWNYPIQIGARGIAPALAAGNTVVVKPAEEASLTCLRLGEIALEAGLPAGALNVVTGYGPEAGAALASHPGINHLTFTGSVETGTLVMQAAAKNVVPVTLELGGKSPQLLFADADMAAAIPVVVRSIIQNAGQTCSAGSRLLVEQTVHRDVVAELGKRFQEVRMGPGMDDPDMGPLISEVQRERVLRYISIGLEEGVRVAVGGSRPTRPDLMQGYFVEPTILDDAPPESRVAQEEIFGPVLTVTPFKSVDEALEAANATQYGLVAGVWTRDINKALWLADRIRAGQVFINTFGAGGGVELPFGGYKRSGFGREKGLEALAHYTQVKNVAIKYA